MVIIFTLVSAIYTNFYKHRYSLIVLTSIMGLLASCSNKYATAPIEAIWILNDDAPTFLSKLHESSQPIVDEGGVRHRILSCRQNEGDLVYEALFDTPYEQELVAIIAVSVDVSDSGEILGFYTVTLPSGRERVMFNTAHIPEPEHTQILEKIASSESDATTECSVHLLGFLNEGEFRIIRPVASKKWDIYGKQN